MRILLQQKTTGLYCQDKDTWTAQPLQALEFPSSSKAVEFCVAQHLDGVQIVLKFEEECYDIVLPVLPESDPPPRQPRRAT